MPKTTGTINTKYRFYTETIEVSRLSAQAFLKQGMNYIKGNVIFGKTKRRH